MKQDNIIYSPVRLEQWAQVIALLLFFSFSLLLLVSNFTSLCCRHWQTMYHCLLRFPQRAHRSLCWFILHRAPLGGHPHEVCTASGHLHACEQPSGEELTCTPDSQPTMKARKRWSWGAIVTVGNVPERERRGECVCCVGVCSTWTHSRVRMREWARRGERARIEMCQWKPNEGGGCAANYSPGSPLMWQPWHRC